MAVTHFVLHVLHVLHVFYSDGDGGNGILVKMVIDVSSLYELCVVVEAF